MLGNRRRRLTIEPMLRGGGWIVTEIEISLLSWREVANYKNTNHWRLKRVGDQHTFKTFENAVSFMHEYYGTQYLPFTTR